MKRKLRSIRYPLLPKMQTVAKSYGCNKFWDSKPYSQCHIMCTFVTILKGASSVVPGGVLVTFTMRYSPTLPGGDDPGVWLAPLVDGATFLPPWGRLRRSVRRSVRSRSCSVPPVPAPCREKAHIHCHVIESFTIYEYVHYSIRFRIMGTSFDH